MNRRQMFSMIGMGAGLAAAGAAGQVTGLYLIDQSKIKKDVEQKMADGTFSIAIQRTYGEIDNSPTPSSTFMISSGPRYIPGTEKHVAAFLNVGPDGHLYAKTNGEWKKLA